MESFSDRLKKMAFNPDLAIAVGLLIVLSIMIIPITPTILDLSIATSLVIAIVIILMSICIY